MVGSGSGDGGDSRDPWGEPRGEGPLDPLWPDERPVGRTGPDPPGRRPRSRWLMALAVVPWLAVVALLLRPGAPPGPGAQGSGAADPRAGGAADGTGNAAGAAPSRATPPAPGPTATPTPGVGSLGTVVRSGARTGPEMPDATALAAVVARTWIGGVGPTVTVPGVPAGAGAAGDVYVDQVALAGVDHPAPGAVVVTLSAVLLHRDGDRYARASVRRLAVPVRLDGRGASPAGQPWWLPAEDLEARPPATEPLGDPALLAEAGAALRAAGYREVAVEALTATDGWPLVATAGARAPGERARRDHVVWLRRHLDGLVVAGDRPRPGTTPAPADAGTPDGGTGP